MKIDTVFLDLDGVIADFPGGVAKIFGRDPSEIKWPKREPWEWVDDDLPDALGITPYTMWQEIKKAGAAFWADLDPYPWAKEVVEYLHAEYRLYFLTTPHGALDSAKGKMVWVEIFSYGMSDRIILTSQKHLLAGWGRLLIDDKPEMVKRFADCGGVGILWPQPWNGYAGGFAPSDNLPITHRLAEIVRKYTEPLKITGFPTRYVKGSNVSGGDWRIGKPGESNA